MVAVALILLMGSAALAVDTGYYQYQQRLQQTAADSAALAGAAEKFGGKNYTQAAKNDASSNGFTDGSNNVTVTVNNPPASPSPFHNDASAVEVIVKAVHPTFFGSVLGWNNVPVSTRAVATVQPAPGGCIFMLDPTQNTNFNNPGGNSSLSISAPNCSIYLNGTGNFNNQTVNALSVNCVGGCSNTSGVTPAATSGGTPANDPCFEIASCAALTNNPPSTATCLSGNFSGNKNSPGLATPGCYSSLSLSGVVNLSPGLYVINGAMTADNATLANATVGGNTGVTIYFTSSGTMSVNKATLNLSACTTTCVSGAEANVLFYQVQGNTNAPNFNKTTNLNLGGLLYFPSASLNLNKSLGTGSVIVAGSANFNGGNYTFVGPGIGSFAPKQAVLGE